MGRMRGAAREQSSGRAKMFIAFKRRTAAARGGGAEAGHDEMIRSVWDSAES